jgi:hypothetical protein
MTAEIQVGEEVRFEFRGPWWLARAATEDKRYVLLTARIDGAVCYTIIDHSQWRRGAMNIIGGGMSIFTTSGPDEAIDEAIQMLASDDGWEISHRNNVLLDIRGRRCTPGSCEGCDAARGPHDGVSE